MDPFAKRTISVLGHKVEVVVDSLRIADISTDMDRVAAQMAYWASVWAAAERQKLEVSAEYRKWKSNALLTAKATEPKDPEWKTRAAVEGSEGFLQWQKNIALAEEAAVLCRGVYSSYEKQSNMLQSRGAMERGILERQGLSTPLKPRSAPVGASTVDEGSDDSYLNVSTPTRELSTDEKIAAVKKATLEKKKAKALV